jgi:hypothetical protein
MKARDAGVALDAARLRVDEADRAVTAAYALEDAKLAAQRRKELQAAEAEVVELRRHPATPRLPCAAHWTLMHWSRACPAPRPAPMDPPPRMHGSPSCGTWNAQSERHPRSLPYRRAGLASRTANSRTSR